jgi:hypothetical protein
MTTGRAIIVGSIVLGACVLVPTAYLIVHNRSVAKEQRQEREQAAKAAADLVSRARAKAAWDESVKFLETGIEIFINRKAGTMNSKAVDAKKYRCLHSMRVKSYANSDVIWNDPKTVTVTGVVAATTIDGHRTQDAETFYSWSATYVWLDANKWGQGSVKDSWRFDSTADPGRMIMEDVDLSPNHEAPCGALN